MPKGRPPSPPKQPALRLVSLQPQPKPPSHLSDEMKKWWTDVTDVYVLDAHHLHLLEAACDSWDRMIQARQALKKYGLTFTDIRGMIRSRPEVAVERDSRLAFVRIVRELQLDPVPSPELSRPPVLTKHRR
jgi:P27 family predicted phage terminase small subunit